MSKCRASYRYLGSQKSRKYHAESLMNLAKTSTWTLRKESSLPTFNGWLSSRVTGVSAEELAERPLYEMSHHSTHAIPAAADRKKTILHPLCSNTTPINGGASTEPTAVPALMMPTAVDRCSGEIHSATTRIAAGNPPPSPIPSRKRAPSSRPKPEANPCSAQAIDHHTMIRAKPRRVPT